MGCRTRVMGNHYDPEQEVTCGRGNLSFTSVNLPRLGIESPQGSGGVLQGAGQVSGTVLQAAAAPLWDPAEEDREELSVSDGAGHLDGFRCAGYP